jgi:hypothetical protein
LQRPAASGMWRPYSQGRLRKQLLGQISWRSRGSRCSPSSPCSFARAGPGSAGRRPGAQPWAARARSRSHTTRSMRGSPPASRNCAPRRGDDDDGSRRPTGPCGGARPRRCARTWRRWFACTNPAGRDARDRASRRTRVAWSTICWTSARPVAGTVACACRSSRWTHLGARRGGGRRHDRQLQRRMGRALQGTQPAHAAGAGDRGGRHRAQRQVPQPGSWGAEL